MNRQNALADVTASVDYLRTVGGAGDVAVVGFSAGGHLAFLAACQLPITRTAVLYGGWLPTTDIPLSRPEPTLTLAPGMTGRLLYLVGQDDTLIDTTQRNQIAAALTSSAVDHELVVYPGTGHAFFWPDTPTFNPTARADAWHRILDLIS
jgi:carboxymethylenebutenolidase